jgi:hypothetical protein
MTLEELKTLKVGDAVVANRDTCYGITEGCIYRVTDITPSGKILMDDQFRKGLILGYHRDEGKHIYTFFDIPRKNE